MFRINRSYIEYHGVLVSEPRTAPQIYWALYHYFSRLRIVSTTIADSNAKSI